MYNYSGVFGGIFFIFYFYLLSPIVYVIKDDILSKK